jgi:hypothetical protein
MVTRADSARSKKGHHPSQFATFEIDGRAVFIGATLLGSAMVFLSEPLGSPIIVGVFGPIALMLVYIALGILGYMATSDRESFADSIYYLGFVLTLVSLAAALVYLRNEKPELGLLVSKFGLALLTTIVGLCVRVAIVNFRMAGSEAKRAADERLSRAIDRFTNDIELTCDKMELLLNGSIDLATTTATEVSSATKLATETMQAETAKTSAHIRELHEESEKQWAETLTKLTADLDETVKAATNLSVERLGELNRKIHDEMDAFVIEPDIVTKKLDPALDDFQQRVGDFAANIGELVDASAGHEELKQQFDQLASALQTGASTVGALQENARTLASAFEDLDSIGETLQTTHTRLVDFSQALQGWADSVTNAIDLVDSGAQVGRLSIDALAQEVQNLVETSRLESEILSDAVSKMASDADTGREAIKLVQQNLIDSTDALTQFIKQK